MASEIKRTIKRAVHVVGVDGVVNVTISEQGLHFSAPKSSKALTISWTQVVRNTTTPTNVPAHLYGDPIKFLQTQAAKRKKAAK
jgi:HD-like signal output (HDOD) protein